MTKEQLWVRTLQYVTDQGVPAGERFKVAKKVYDTMAFLVKPPVEPSVEQLAERINAAHKSVDDQFAKEAYESSAPAAGHWAKLHQWGQDKDYHWYQSCPCSRCSAHTAAIAREQQDHLARGETSWISTIDPP